MMYLLDTNVVSELRKIRSGKADAQVTLWADRVDAADLYVSVVTIQELEIGVLLAERRDPAQGAILRTWLNEQVLPAFAGRILSVDTAVAQHSARLHVPNPHPVRDGLIAATALVHGMTVVTRNVADFESTKVPNPSRTPWTSRPFNTPCANSPLRAIGSRFTRPKISAPP
jgi:predicted nucleic acid-binding protein